MYPDFIDGGTVPHGIDADRNCGRNWMTRRMLIESIRNDPEWNGGNYTREPRSLYMMQTFFSIATSGGNRALHKAAPTREKADQLVTERLAQLSRRDANDMIYQYEASRDYNPAPNLERIKARLLAISSTDDERNPPELGIAEQRSRRPAGPLTS